MRKVSKSIKCEICGKMCAARGIKSHMRLQHQISVKEEIKEIVQRTYVPIEPNLSQVNISKTVVNTGVDLSGVDLSKRFTEEQMRNYAKSSDAMKKWYVRDKNGDMLDIEFATQEEAINFIKNSHN